MKNERLIIDEAYAETQWLYVAIERYPARLIGDRYLQLLTQWQTFDPEIELILDNIWEISPRFIEQFYGAVDSRTEVIIDDFIARQIWLEKISKKSIIDDSIRELLIMLFSTGW